MTEGSNNNTSATTTGWLRVVANPQTKLSESTVTVDLESLLVGHNRHAELENMVEIVTHLHSLKVLKLVVTRSTVNAPEHVLRFLKAFVHNQRNGALHANNNSMRVVLESSLNYELLEILELPEAQDCVRELCLRDMNTTESTSLVHNAEFLDAVSSLSNCHELRIRDPSFDGNFLQQLLKRECRFRRLVVDRIATYEQATAVVGFVGQNHSITTLQISEATVLAATVLVAHWQNLSSRTATASGDDDEDNDEDGSEPVLVRLEGGIQQLAIDHLSSPQEAHQTVRLLNDHSSIRKLDIARASVPAARVLLAHVATHQARLQLLDPEKEIKLAATSDNTLDLGGFWPDFSCMGFRTPTPWGLGVSPEGFEEMALETTQREVEGLVGFINEVMANATVYVTLNKAETREYWENVALPLVEAAKESKAQEIALHLGFGNREHLNLLRQEACRDDVTFIEPWDEAPPSDRRAATDTVAALTKLKTLMLVGASHEYFSWLSGVNFATTLTRLDVWDVRKPEDISEAIRFLKRNPQIKAFEMYDSRSTWEPSFPDPDLFSIVSSTGCIGLHKFALSTRRTGAVTDAFVSSLASVLSNLSPQLKELDLSLDVDPDTKKKLETQLIPAMEDNKDALALERFRFECFCQPDGALAHRCKAFAARKTMERSIQETTKGPLLPNAVTAVRRHSHLRSKTKRRISANIIWNGLRKRLATDKNIGSTQLLMQRLLPRKSSASKC